MTAAQPEYIQEDAQIVGKEIHAFADGADHVTVVLGDFRLTLGARAVSGRDAVLWIRSYRVGTAERHEITAYVEGDAKVVEPGGAATTDRTMLVTVRCQGRLATPGQISTVPLLDLPLYARAKAQRQREALLAAAQPTQPRSRRAGIEHEAPDLTVQKPRDATSKPQAEPPASQLPPPTAPTTPTTAEAPDAAAPTAKAPDAKAPDARAPGAKAPGAKASSGKAPKGPPQPVALEAGSFSSQRKGDRRYTIARGGVYLSQGNPDSDLFLELRSQEAVVFSIPADVTENIPPKDTTSPLSPRIGGGVSPLGGRERITGAYLEGDVRISRGDRSLSGSSAYYDFTTDRAIVLDPVFQTVQEQRNIPIYVRAREARMLSAREVWFGDAKVSTSDFYTPTYHIGATSTYVMDTTPYDPEGVRTGDYSWLVKMRDTTFNIRGVPVLYSPYAQGDLDEITTPIRKFQVTKDSDFGFGVNTEWNLFRLLGLVRPKGFRGELSFDLYEKEVAAGIDLKYAREDYSGYSRIRGMFDQNNSDDFGTEVRNVPAPESRGRVLMRHKQFLPQDWQLQFELSYLCDKNYLREFEPDELYAGKEQETLLYAKKQRDNWAVDALLKYRINRFMDQTESAPDVGAYVIGEPLLNDRLTFFSESHAGIKRYRPANSRPEEDSDFFGRLDTREEVDYPLHLGPVNVVPYAVGRLTYWGDTPDGGDEFRAYGQLGLRLNTHFWRVYNDVESRIWDLHRLKHVITPFATMFLASHISDQAMLPNLYPMDPDTEGLDGKGGIAFGINQVLQTKRGPPGQQQTVDWMRLNLSAGWFGNETNSLPGDGRYFFYRPENSLGRNFINADYEWRVSETTLLQAYANFDVDRSKFTRYGASLAVARNPRLRYLFGFRSVPDMDSTIASVGVSYQISKKYTINAFEQYDFDYRGGSNLVTTVTITRKFPRWYAAFTLQYDKVHDDVLLMVTFWPEGIPEFRIGDARMSVLGRSSNN